MLHIKVSKLNNGCGSLLEKIRYGFLVLFLPGFLVAALLEIENLVPNRESKSKFFSQAKFHPNASMLKNLLNGFLIS